jgi:hypothetical protein
MKSISVKMPFDSAPDQTKEAFRKLIREVYKSYLGRMPTETDVTNFKKLVNADNSSINDLYFEGKKIGSLATTYILDSPRGISLDFIPVGKNANKED